MSHLDQLNSLFSDLYKDARGFRPRVLFTSIEEASVAIEAIEAELRDLAEWEADEAEWEATLEAEPPLFSYFFGGHAMLLDGE